MDFPLKYRHAAQLSLLSFSTFEGPQFKSILTSQRTTEELFYPPSNSPNSHLPIFLSLSLSLSPPLWCFCGWEAVTKGTGCHCHHGDGLRRASQLLRGTINKHQSLVNISPAGTERQPGPNSARVHRRCIMERWWKTKGEQEADRMGITAPRREGWWDEWSSRRPEEVRKTSLSFHPSGRKCHVLFQAHGIISRNVIFTVIFWYLRKKTNKRSRGSIRWGPWISVAWSWWIYGTIRKGDNREYPPPLDHRYEVNIGFRFLLNWLSLSWLTTSLYPQKKQVKLDVCKHYGPLIHLLFVQEDLLILWFMITYVRKMMFVQSVMQLKYMFPYQMKS